LLKKKSILIFLIISFFNITSLIANEKLKIIENINNIETLKFNFVQISFDNKENGICFLKRPHFLKCIYEDKNQKELIVNRRNLVIYHKKYNKTYYYPVSKSYFVDILDKKKFKSLILDGDLSLNEEIFEIKYSAENKGEIIFFFDKENFNLSGWEITDLNGNHTNFKIKNLNKNQDLDNKLFSIPEIN
tara:strand:- start:322 stop:888 length:567 start_codon:yes stop_codon:yes gene_type:complete